MHDDQSALSPLGDDEDTNNGLARPRGRHQDADVVREKRFGPRGLDGGQLTFEIEAGNYLLDPFIPQYEVDSVIVEQLFQACAAPSGRAT